MDTPTKLRAPHDSTKLETLCKHSFNACRDWRESTAERLLSKSSVNVKASFPNFAHLRLKTRTSFSFLMVLMTRAVLSVTQLSIATANAGSIVRTWTAVRRTEAQDYSH